MKRFAVTALVSLIIITLPLDASAWNIPGHILSGAIAYQILQRESPATIPRVRSILENNPWYESRWRTQLEKLPETDRNEMLFMLAARWADDISTKDPSLSRPLWDFVDFPYKPEGEPESIKTVPPLNPNLLTAIAENERAAQSRSEPEKRGIALTWLFHLVGDIHQPLHAVQLFTREYPHGDRGGSDICVRVAENRPGLRLHRFWDGLLTSSQNLRTLRNMAAELWSRFPRSSLSELGLTTPEAWTKESFEIAVKIAYQNGVWRGTPKGQQKECNEVKDAAVLPLGYAKVARKIAERRMMLAGYRLAEVLQSISKFRSTSD